MTSAKFVLFFIEDCCVSIDFDNDILDCSLICRYILGRILIVHGTLIVERRKLEMCDIGNESRTEETFQ